MPHDEGSETENGRTVRSWQSGSQRLLAAMCLVLSPRMGAAPGQSASLVVWRDVARRRRPDAFLASVPSDARANHPEETLSWARWPVLYVEATRTRFSRR